MTWFAGAVLVLLIARAGAQLWLERLNRLHALAHGGVVPGAFAESISPETHARGVDYTVAKSRFYSAEVLYGAALLVAVLYSGVLPWAYGWVSGKETLIHAGFLLAVGLALSLVSLPLEYYHQFRLEERFGFNTMTPGLWWLDHLKGWALMIAFGLPLVWLILKFVDWTGEWWWLWSWALLTSFQLVMAVVAPWLIMPLFNKFEPLPPGPLRERLLALATRTAFQARNIEVMDGSKRSRHSNAFFTGFGKFRKIVLFDTLMNQLETPELEAVLAHEIGHYKKRHIPKMLVGSALMSLAGFYALDLLAGQAWFAGAFGFAEGGLVPALLLFGLLSGLVGFWISPLAHWWSRRYEYEADAYAAGVMGESGSLIGALRKLAEKNLSNLNPHPLYSGFYYSHPALAEREAALKAG